MLWSKDKSSRTTNLQGIYKQVLGDSLARWYPSTVENQESFVIRLSANGKRYSPVAPSRFFFIATQIPILL